MFIKYGNLNLLPGGGNGKKLFTLSGGAIGRSNFCPKLGIENQSNFGLMGGAESRGGAIGSASGVSSN